MGTTQTDGVRLIGTACAVPDRVATTEEDALTFGADEMAKISQATGIRRRRIAPPGLCTSDLCVPAADALLAAAGWDRGTIDVLILVTQTPDYILPATACSLHQRLKLSTGCAAFDVNLGCSGYTYGLWLAAHLIAGGAAQRVLLLAGDVASRRVNRLDRSARPLFGDAGTATLLERDPDAGRMYFRFGTDGSGQNHLLIPAGGYRCPDSPQTWEPHVDSDGNTRSLGDVYMNGAEVFMFTLAEVPPLLKGVMGDAGWTAEDVDRFVLHQANEFMLKHLARSARIPMDKVPVSLADFGNTSSASIPLTMTTQLRESLADGSRNLILAGFGVGLSWSAVALRTQQLVMPPLVEVSVEKTLAQLNDPDPEVSHLPASLRKDQHG